MLWHAPAKIKRGGHFGVLTGMPVFQNITLHRATNSAQSQDKIRLVFHFVERNNIAYLFLYVPQIIARQNIACIYKHLLYQQFLIRMSTVNICLTFSASQRPITAFTEWLVSQSSNNITVQSVCTFMMSQPSYGVPKQWKDRHVGVPNQSWGSWTLLFHSTNMPAGHVSAYPLHSLHCTLCIMWLE